MSEPIEIKLDNKEVESRLLDLAKRSEKLRPLMKNIAGVFAYSNNAFVAQHLFPEITSEKEKIDIFEFNKEAFNLYDTERAIRANSNVISPQGFKKHTTTLAEHDLSYGIRS